MNMQPMDSDIQPTPNVNDRGMPGKCFWGGLSGMFWNSFLQINFSQVLASFHK